MVPLTAWVLCVNAGSSSLKVAVRSSEGAEGPWCAIEEIGRSNGFVTVGDAAMSATRRWDASIADHGAAIDLALRELASIGGLDVVAVGHRVVHGGRHLAAPALVNGAVLAELRRVTQLAPLHLPAQIAAIETVAAQLPGLPHVACFDTAFHHAMPELSRRLPLPDWAWTEGIVRFGFHGLSYEHVVDVLGPHEGRTVIAHLGNGASMAAVRDGIPVDTTMGFSPAGGLIMGTRSGDLDPGVILYLLRHRRMGVDEVAALINRGSGLLGISGTTSDMRDLLAARAADPRAARAVAMFCRSARSAIGGLAATLGGLDQLVFTGGIGEHSAVVRSEICDGLQHLGVAIDAPANERSAPMIGAPDTTCPIRIVPADEERVIARHAIATVHGTLT